MRTAEVYQPRKSAVSERADPCDTELGKRVRLFLDTRGIHELENIHIDVDGGTVVLRGPIDSRHDRWLCVNCSSHVAGVLHVVDKLEDGNGAARIKRPR